MSRYITKTILVDCYLCALPWGVYHRQVIIFCYYVFGTFWVLCKKLNFLLYWRVFLYCQSSHKKGKYPWIVKLWLQSLERLCKLINSKKLVEYNISIILFNIPFSSYTLLQYLNRHVHIINIKWISKFYIHTHQ